MQIITARSGAGYSQPWHVYDPSIGIILGKPPLSSHRTDSFILDVIDKHLRAKFGDRA